MEIITATVTQIVTGEHAVTIATWALTTVTGLAAHRSLPEHKRHHVRDTYRRVAGTRYTAKHRAGESHA